MGRKFRPAEGVPQEGGSLRRRAARPDYKIDPETGCWIWQKYLNTRGYPCHAEHRTPICSASRALTEPRAFYERSTVQGPLTQETGDEGYPAYPANPSVRALSSSAGWTTFTNREDTFTNHEHQPGGDVNATEPEG